MIAPIDNDVYLKIKWANYHFLEFQNFFRTWVKSDAYGVAVEIDPHTQEVVYRLRPTFAVPATFALFAGDVIQNLRTALDYLACALVRKNDGKITTQIGFPILKDAPPAPEYEGSLAGKVVGMRKEAIDKIRKTKPYKGGDEVLWRLHCLNNIDKHRLLFTVGAFLDDWSITQHIDATDMPLEQMERLGRAYASEEHWANVRKASFPLKAGDELLRDPPHSKVNENIKFGIQVAINEPGVCEGEPLRLILGSRSPESCRLSGSSTAGIEREFIGV